MAVGAEVLVAEAAHVVDVLQLLGDVGVVRLLLEQVAAAAELVGVVKLQREARVDVRLEEGAEAQRATVEHGQLRVAVAVVVVARAVACLAEEGDAQAAVVAHHGAVEVRRVLKRVQAAQSARLVREGGGVACRFAGDDVDRARDGRRSEQRRSAATHHLDTLDHVGRDLLQPVDARQRAEDGS